MIVVEEFAGKRVAVLGLARSGRAAVRALLAGGAEVLAWDDNAKARGWTGATSRRWRCRPAYR
jgi:UDP-N-acetylmuramoylalanine--D-glutamate ligase